MSADNHAMQPSNATYETIQMCSSGYGYTARSPFLMNKDWKSQNGRTHPDISNAVRNTGEASMRYSKRPLRCQ